MAEQTPATVVFATTHFSWAVHLWGRETSKLLSIPREGVVCITCRRDITSTKVFADPNHTPRWVQTSETAWICCQRQWICHQPRNCLQGPWLCHQGPVNWRGERRLWWHLFLKEMGTHWTELKVIVRMNTLMKMIHIAKTKARAHLTLCSVWYYIFRHLLNCYIPL